MEVLVGMAASAGDPVVGGIVGVGDLSEGEQAQKINITPNNHREIRESWPMIYYSIRLRMVEPNSLAIDFFSLSKLYKDIVKDRRSMQGISQH
jgi:hypothetical protein